MRTGRGQQTWAFAIAAVAAAFAVLAQPALARTPLLSAKPELKPKFSERMLDYTVRCKKGEPVRFEVHPPAGARASLDGGKWHTDHFTGSADLTPGRAAELAVRRSGHTHRYRARCLPPDFPHWAARRGVRPQAQWYLATIIHTVEEPGYAVVFDSHGVPVWWKFGQQAPFNIDLLPDGNLVWTGYVALSPATGPFTEWTLAGRMGRQWQTIGAPLNQHEFQMLPNGNALMIAYPRRDDVDLSRWDGPKHATVFDGEIQEVDPTGHRVFRWNTRDHIPLRESDHWGPSLIKNPRVETQDKGPVYDIVHMNSLSPDGDGRVVFSARYLDAVYAVDRRTGKVAWKLGGTHTKQSLKIEGDPLGDEDFGGQHDARVLDGGRTLTIYDNGTGRHRTPRALEFRLDLKHRSARLVNSVEFPLAGKSGCCGSARRLPGGNWAMDWGGTQWLTEQTSKGDLALAIRLPTGDRSYRFIPVPHGRLTRSQLAAGMDAMSGG